MTAKQPLLRATAVSKRYEIYGRPVDRLKQMMWRGRRQFYTEFWALRDVSLTLEPGETLGLIGQNGAGKSTLLQLLAATLSPTAGTIERNGRVAAILELGAGFNPEFTGRENAALNASLLGIDTARQRHVMPEIESFADIGAFFDRPVKMYSSGMYSRLAFAVASAVDPDILIVDEALAVGDTRFQAKCFRRLEQFQAAGKAILFVTHSVDLVLRHCSRALLLERGSAIAEGAPKDVVHTYLNLLFGAAPRAPSAQSAPRRASTEQQAGDRDAFVANTSDDDRLAAHPAYNNSEYRWGHGGAAIVDALLLAPGKPSNSTVVDADDELTVCMRIAFTRDVPSAVIGLTVRTPDGVAVAGTNSRDWSSPGTSLRASGGDIVCVSFRFAPRLGGGDYMLSLGVAELADGEIVPLDRRYDCLAITVIGQGRTSGLADLGISFDVMQAATQSAPLIASAT